MSDEEQIIFETNESEPSKTEIETEIEAEGHELKPEPKGKWELVHEHPNYEIYSCYPYIMRHVDTHYLVSEYETNSGYVQCKLGKISLYKHRIVAYQWIPNPTNLPIVDHLNHDRSDYRIENLRWTSRKGNSNNLGATGRTHKPVKYVDELPPGAFAVPCYSKWEFDDLYYWDEMFYFDTKKTEDRYKKQKPFSNHGYYRITATDVTGKQRAISLQKFKREYVKEIRQGSHFNVMEYNDE